MKEVTTGNSQINDIFFEKLHLPFNMQESLNVSKKLKAQFQWYQELRSFLILDFGNEDPQIFKSGSPNYFSVVTKRGFLFNFAGVVLLLLGFWVFVIRLAYGDCGGYKTRIKKPAKSDRYSVQFMGLIGISLFIGAFFFTIHCVVKDKIISDEISYSLNLHNQHQLDIVAGVKKFIRDVKYKRMEVRNSDQPFERFRIGYVMDGVEGEYEESTNNSKTISDSLFKDTKNDIISRLVLIFFTTLSCVIGFTYAYKRRKLLVSLILTFVLLFIGVICFNTINNLFNVWSINIDICHNSLGVADVETNGDIRFIPDNDFRDVLTCLSRSGKKKVNMQMNNLMIAQNSVFTILWNFFNENDKMTIGKGYFNSALSLHTNYETVKERLKIALENEKNMRIQKKQPIDTKLKDKMNTYLKMTKEINQKYNDLEVLSRCHELVNWIDEFNHTVCSKGLNYQYMSMWGMLVLAISILIIGGCIYISENMIRGLYNEEIQYVKTNKLRYDWN